MYIRILYIRSWGTSVQCVSYMTKNHTLKKRGRQIKQYPLYNGIFHYSLKRVLNNEHLIQFIWQLSKVPCSNLKKNNTF